MRGKNKTAVFLGPSYNQNRASLELVDVQPLHGGVRVLLPSWTRSEAYVSHFAPGGAETKYRIPLKWLENEKEQLIQLCVEQDFLTIQPEARLGIPDEARPSLTLQNHRREKQTVAKWRNSTPFAPTSEQMWYAVLGYAGVITAVLLLALAGPLMPRLLNLIDERF